MSILPDVPRLPTIRSKMADCVFVLLLFCSRLLYLIGAVMGSMHYGFVGLFPGLAAGALAGFCMGRSLGLRGRHLTKGFHCRMFERGTGKPAGILEALVEMLRGNRLTLGQCRHIGTAYSAAAHQLRGGGSTKEQRVILAARDQQILAISYGFDSMAATDQSVEQTSGANFEGELVSAVKNSG